MSVHVWGGVEPMHVPYTLVWGRKVCIRSWTLHWGIWEVHACLGFQLLIYNPLSWEKGHLG